ncbi:MAG: ABC transporter ATP-binding protein [Chitinophagales bacterium]|nr:ABC transporter ATP-binding protein [Chitinophagales bacterium]
MSIFNTFFRPVKSAEDQTAVKDQFRALRNLPPFFRMVWNTNKGLTIASILLRLSRSATPLAMLYLGKLIIDRVLWHIHTPGTEPLGHLYLLIGMEMGLVVLSELLSRSIILTDSLLGDQFSNASSVQLIKHAATLDLWQFEDPTFYDKLERARRQTVGRVMLISQVMSQFQDMITILFLAGGLLAFNPWLLLILVVAVIPAFIGESYFNERSYSLSRSWTPERRELDYLRYIGASDETAKEIKIFGLADFIADRFKSLSDRYYASNKKLTIQRAAWGSLLSFLGTLSYYGAYVFIVLQAVAGGISIGSLTFLAGSFNQMRNILQGVMSRFSQIAEGALYLQDLFDFLAIRPNVPAEKTGLPIPRPIKQGFTFENVGFKYLNSDKWALRHVSFHLNAGEKLALVGENGAGKTTLVKLLARLYEPVEGRILLDGIDLRDYDLTDLRRETGVIFQDYVKFQMNVSENIAIGRIDARDDLPRIENSARKSLADAVIARFPDKYHQMLGKRFSKGVELSGGEWQKVALARAYMGDAQLLILDEPTSALDARAENEVFLRFSELIEGRTAVLISHRFSTVRMADRILLLEGGQMKELGSHEELLAQGGKYAELFQLQAKGYV